LVANFFYAFKVLGELAFVLTEVDLYFFDKFVKKHLHNCEVVFELFHDLVSDIIVDEKFVLVFREGLTIDFAFFETDVAFVGDHALPFGEDKDEDFGFVEGDIELIHCKAVVNFE
jgi:hypothetical protein